MFTNTQQFFLGTKIHYNVMPEELASQSLTLGQGKLSDTGALVITTGKFTGRSPKDKFIVKDALTATTVDWNNFNNPIDEKYFLLLQQDMLSYLKGKEELWVRDVYACPDNEHQFAVRVVNDTPWANLFTANMFTTAAVQKPSEFEPQWQIIQATGFTADIEKHGTRAENFAVLSFTHKTVLIGGTAYTGEIKKGVFTILNFLFPQNHNILGMHCSANVGKEGDTALFFGLSGTGKTTLSTDPDRSLVGDDEHGWADDSVFNFESGCYAKVINLSKENEPDIFNAIRGGALVENTAFFEGTNSIDFSDASVTENTRVSYPLSFIKNTVVVNSAAVPKNIFFLSCDAYGVLPPVSRLTQEQAMYYFISGYTARIAGTEEGVKEPQATFSACFGAPFLPLHPGVYAKLLGEKIAENNVKVWMINTGWTGGPYGIGTRIKLSLTRAMINAVLNGSLDKVTYSIHPVFGIEVPDQCEGITGDILNPELSWGDAEKYLQAAQELAQKLEANFTKYADGVAQEIAAAGPKNFKQITNG
jgi:phosphoenolpyruvate carboxykinase (ATP)